MKRHDPPAHAFLTDPTGQTLDGDMVCGWRCPDDEMPCRGASSASFHVSRAEIIPITFRDACRYVAAHHRHNEPPRGHKFSIGLERDGQLVGVVMASRPVARGSDDGRTLELVRLTTEGDRNACSRLYSAACRAGFAMGYRRVITYTLEDEPGSSLRASGFTIDGVTSGGEWKHTSGPRSADMPRLWEAAKMPTGPKTRWLRTA